MRCRRHGRPGAPTRMADDARPRAACVILMRGGHGRQGSGRALPGCPIVAFAHADAARCRNGDARRES
ncbi:hypothetical protein WT97_29555 [Burkholderia sp. MSMB1459WGS]|nr:hypothetical protein WT97_29555 [Burkholderia sp. MSMB1459WGS]